jgi:hypothetical protein
MPPDQSSLMTIQTVFLVLIALVVPVFFALLFVTSAYHRLAALRLRCEQILSLAKGTSDPEELRRLRRAHEEAVAMYEHVQRRFPHSVIAALFRFSPPKPWPIADSSPAESANQRNRTAP